MLKFQDIHKVYSNSKVALKGLSFDVKENEFIALLGPNGAGKSTLINILSGNVVKTSGKLFVDGNDFDDNELLTKRLIGVIPQDVSYDSFFTVNEVLQNQSGYFGIKDNQAYIDELLEDLSLTDKKHVNTKALSGGMKRRLLIAKALVHKPKLIVLDEPTAGVDVELRQNLYDFLQKLHASGKTIILTTHYLEEAEKLCDRVVVVNEGEIIADASKDELKSEFAGSSQISFKLADKYKKEDLSFLESFSFKLTKGILKVECEKDQIYVLFNKLINHKIKFTDIRVKEEKLEDVFLKLTSR